MKRDYDLLVIDLDGTLLDDDSKVSDENLLAIHNAQKAGVEVAIASGRVSSSILRIMKQMGLDVMMSCYNGAMTREKPSSGWKVLREHSICADVAVDIVSLAKEKNIALNYYLDEVIYAEKNPAVREMLDFYSNHTKCEYKFVDDLHEFDGSEPTKLLMTDKPETQQIRQVEFAQMFKGRVKVLVSNPEYLEFLHLEATKGAGITDIALAHNIDISRTMAIGDANNDIEMLRAAGLGVAMRNGTRQAQGSANVITTATNNYSGVAEAINQYLL